MRTPLLAAAAFTFTLAAAASASPLPSAAGSDIPHPESVSQLSGHEVRDIGRLAQTINFASCPEQPLPQTLFGQKPSVLISSADEDQPYDLEDAPDLNWYVSRSGSTLRLAISSLPTVEEFVEILAEPRLVPPPAWFFPSLVERQGPLPLVHGSLIPALESHGLAATVAVLDTLNTLEALPLGFARRMLHVFRRGPTPITKIEITGHGLGAATALLVALAIKLETANGKNPAPAVEATLFGLPRVGDEAFATWVDSLTEDGHLTIRRVTNGADAVPHLPGRHLNFVHPASASEIWLTDDGLVRCTAASGSMESELCAASIALSSTGLGAHSGPYVGVSLGVCPL